MKPDPTPSSLDPDVPHSRLVFVTGPSGAGRSTVVKALEDIGFEAIDNIPLSLVPRLVDGPPIGRSLALGIDVRNRDFSVPALIDMIDETNALRGTAAELLYLDCSPDVLIRRFSETRRPHPLAPAELPLHGIEQEIELLVPIRACANILIDTSDMTPHQLRREVERLFGVSPEKRLAVTVQSFSYKRGIPRGADLVLDCRFLNNPYWTEDLRNQDGRRRAVAEYVEKDKRFAEFFVKISELVHLLLPAYAAEGKAHLTVAFGCTGGHHRSVAVAEKLADALAASGWQVSKRHRELDRVQATETRSSTDIEGKT